MLGNQWIKSHYAKTKKIKQKDNFTFLLVLLQNYNNDTVVTVLTQLYVKDSAFGNFIPPLLLQLF